MALVYDRVNKWGGAERVLLALHKIFPDAPLYTSVYHPQKAAWAKVFDVRPSFLQNFPFAKDHHEIYATFMPLAFESFSFDNYDLVVSVTSEAAKGILTKPGTKHICYCLTPTRYLWSGYDEYFKNPILRFISKPVVWYLRIWDKIAAQRPDKIIAISKEVRMRIKKYYGLDSEIIYPPLMVGAEVASENFRAHRAGKFGLINKKSKGARPRSENFESSPRLTDKWKMENGQYFLVVSRLVPYKKIDLAVKVFNKLNLPLKIIGKGSEEDRLKAIAKSNIEFLGYLTDEELVKYYKGCRALIFPGKEDFGLSLIEAQSFGKPVIAYKEGGVLESVVEGKTGIFFAPQTSRALEEAVKRFMRKKFNPDYCKANAQRFSFDQFERRFEEEIKLVSNI